ncbi:MAG: glycosyltransferase family 61 protein [Spirochaetota bacterium]
MYKLVGRSRALRFLGRRQIYRRKRAAPRLLYLDDLKAEAPLRGWIYTPVSPMVVQMSVPSKTIPEDALEIVQHAQRLVKSHYARAGGMDCVSRMWYATLLSVMRYPVYETFTCEIPDVFIGVPNGEVISNAFEALTQSSRLKWAEVFMDHVPDPGRRLPGTCVSLLGLFSTDYGHWMIDILTRLALIPDRLNDFLYIVPEGELPRFKLESLDLLGISREQLVPLARGWHRLERVLICHQAQRSIVPKRQHLLDLRNTFYKAAFDGEERSAPWRKVYVSRNKSRRKILNEPEILPVLRDYGFERYFCEELSFKDQVRLFAETRYILGPHGAGLNSDILCEPGATVIELLNPARWNPCVRGVANIMGHEHWYLFGENRNQEYDMTVDPMKLEKLLAYVFEREHILELEY